MGIKLHNAGMVSEVPLDGPHYDVELDGHLCDMMNAVADILSKNIDILNRAKENMLKQGSSQAMNVLINDAQVDLLEALKMAIKDECERKRHDAAGGIR